MIPRPVIFIQCFVCNVKKDFFISGSCVLTHFGMDFVVIERFSNVFNKRRTYSSSSKVKSQLNHLSLSISSLSECRDCWNVFSTCSLKSSLKLSFSKCFRVNNYNGINRLGLLQQSEICSFNNLETPAPTMSFRSFLTRFQNSFEWMSLTS